MADDEMQEIPVKKEPRPPVGTNVESESKHEQAPQPVDVKSGQKPPADFSELPGEPVERAEPTPAAREPQQKKVPAGESPPVPPQPPTEEKKAEQPKGPGAGGESMQEVHPPEDLKELRESETEAEDLLDESKPRYMRMHKQEYPGSREQAVQDITPVSSEPRPVSAEERVNKAIELHDASQSKGPLAWVKRKLGFK